MHTKYNDLCCLLFLFLYDHCLNMLQYNGEMRGQNIYLADKYHDTKAKNNQTTQMT